ncbi:MAG: DUF1292 domain-containing protein [Tumebacillaceae bacterium]|jgi:uncharacterized protein YrzB (UPF0473 family)
MSEVETNKVITLTDEEGSEHEFEVLEMLEVDQKTYTILQPLDAEDDEAIILRLDKDEEGNDVLSYIEDDEEWDKVAETYDTLLFEEQGGSDDDL